MLSEEEKKKREKEFDDYFSNSSSIVSDDIQKRADYFDSYFGNGNTNNFINKYNLETDQTTIKNELNDIFNQKPINLHTNSTSDISNEDNSYDYKNEQNYNLETDNKEAGLGEKAWWVARKTGAGVVGGTAGLGQAVLTDTANNLQKGNEKGLEGINEDLKDTNKIQKEHNQLINKAVNSQIKVKEIMNDEKSSTVDKVFNLFMYGIGQVMDIFGSARENTAAGKLIDTPVQVAGALLPENSSQNVMNLNNSISKPIEEMNTRLAEEGQNYGTATQFIGNAMQAVGNMAPSIAATAITKNPNIGLSVMGLSAKGQSTQEALSKGVELNKAVQIGDEKAMVEIGTEMLTGGVNIFGKGALDDILEKGIVDRVKNKVGKFLVKQGVNATGETLEETISDIIDTAIDKDTVDPNATYTLSDWSETAIETTLTTFVLNLLTGGVVNDIQTIKNEPTEFKTIVNQDDIKPLYVTNKTPDGDISFIQNTTGIEIENSNKNLNINPAIFYNNKTETYNVLDKNTGLLLDSSPYQSIIEAKTKFNHRILNLSNLQVKNINNNITKTELALMKKAQEFINEINQNNNEIVNSNQENYNINTASSTENKKSGNLDNNIINYDYGNVNNLKNENSNSNNIQDYNINTNNLTENKKLDIFEKNKFNSVYKNSSTENNNVLDDISKMTNQIQNKSIYNQEKANNIIKYVADKLDNVKIETTSQLGHKVVSSYDENGKLTYSIDLNNKKLYTGIDVKEMVNNLVSNAYIPTSNNTRIGENNYGREQEYRSGEQRGNTNVGQEVNTINQEENTKRTRKDEQSNGVVKNKQSKGIRNYQREQQKTQGRDFKATIVSNDNISRNESIVVKGFKETIGLDINIYNTNKSTSEGAFFDENEIYLKHNSLANKKATNFKPYHELGHWLKKNKPKQWKRLYNIMNNTITDKQINDYKTVLNHKEIFDNMSKEQKKDYIINEIISDYLGNWANDIMNWENYVHLLSKEYQQFIADITLENEITGYNVFGTLEQQDKMYEEITNIMKDIINKKNTSLQINPLDEQNNAISFSNRKDTELGNYWQVEDSKDLFKGITKTKDLQTKAYQYILNGDNNFERITDKLNGKDIQFIRVSAQEYVYGRNAQELTKNDGQKAYNKKMRLAPSIQDLIDNADITYQSPPTHKNKLFDNFSNYQGKVGIDNYIFKYIVRVGIMKKSGNSIFYDISLEVLKGQKNKADKKSLVSKNDTSLKSASIDNSISHKQKNVKTNKNTVINNDMQKMKNNTNTKYSDRYDVDNQEYFDSKAGIWYNKNGIDITSKEALAKAIDEDSPRLHKGLHSKFFRDSFFIFNKLGHNEYIPIMQMKIQGNENYINSIRKDLKNGIIRKTQDVIRTIEEFNNRGGFDNINNANVKGRTQIESNTEIRNKRERKSNNRQNNTTSNENSNKQLKNSKQSSFSMQDKEKQLEIIKQNNPMLDDYHTGIRTIDDIKTFEETLQDNDWKDYDEFNPDFTRKMANEAVQTREIMVYSFYPIKQGTFVSPSYMEAESYSGNGKVYSKKVRLIDVAWIDPTQGQYAKVNTMNENIRLADRNDFNNDSNTSNQNYTPEEQEILKKKKQERVELAKIIKERGFLHNVLTSNVDKEFKKKLRNNRENFQYEPISNSETMKKASETVNKYKDFESAKNDFLQNDLTSATDTAVGELLVKKALAQGNYEEACNLTASLAEKLTTAGQTVQAAAMFKRMTADGMLLFAQRKVNQINKELSKEYGIDKLLGGKNASQIELTEDKVKFINSLMQQMEAYENQKKTVTDGATMEIIEREQDVIIAKVMAKIGEDIPTSVLDKITAWRNISLLLNTKTIKRNIISNVTFSTLENVVDVIGVPIDKAISLITGERSLLLPNLKTQAKGLKKGLDYAIEDTRLGISTSLGGNKYEIKPTKTFKNKLLGKLETLSYFGVEGLDRPFMQAKYDSALEMIMKLEGLTYGKDIPTEQMKEEALSIAKYTTFKDKNAISDFLSKTKNTLNLGKSIGAADVIGLTYTNIPGNLTKKAIDYSPAGLYNIIKSYKNLKAKKIGGESIRQAQRELVQATTRVLIGTGIMSVSIAAALAGVITASGDDEDDKVKELTNQENYAINVSAFLRWITGGDTTKQNGDLYVTYSNYEPLSSIIAAAAEMTSAAKEGDSIGTIGYKGLTTWINTIAELSTLNNFSSLFEYGDLGGTLTRSLAQFPSSFIPTTCKQIAQLFEVNSKSSYSDNYFVKNLLNPILQRIPGLSSTLESNYDTMGNEKESYNGSRGLARVYNVFLNTSFTSTVDMDSTKQELYDLYLSTGSTDHLPLQVKNYFMYKGQKITLTAEEKAKYQETLGKRTAEAFKKKMSTSDYKSMTDEDKVKALQSIINDINNEVKGEVILEPRGLAYDSTFTPTGNSLSKNGYRLNLTEDMQKEYEKVASDYYSKYKNQGLYNEEKLEQIKSKAKDYAKNYMFSKYKSNITKTNK